MTLIYTTVKTEKEAERIAFVLLKNKLAACINFSPIKSVYLWHGKIERVKEVSILIKTLPKLKKKTIAKIRSVHPYSIPSIITFKGKAEKDYEAWAKKELNQRYN